MSDDKMTEEEKREMQRKRHLALLDDPKTRKRWDGSYRARLAEPQRLLEALDEFCYGGDAVREDLRVRIEAQRSWPEGLSFEDWWRYGGPWPRVSEPTPEGEAWRALMQEAWLAAKRYLRKEQCLHRHVYRIRSRNLSFGAYNANTGGFCGIREKFDRRYIFEEYHWDNGPPYGTVHPQEDLGELPEGLEPVETLGTFGSESGREVWWDRDAADEANRFGRRRYKDTNEFCEEQAQSRHNDALFKYLDRLQKEDMQR